MVTIQIGKVQVIILGALLFCVLAVVGTVGGLVVGGLVLPGKSVPSRLPQYRAPGYVPSGGSSAGSGSSRDTVWVEYEKSRAEDCQRQWRDYQKEYTDYVVDKNNGGATFNPMRPPPFNPMRPAC